MKCLSVKNPYGYLICYGIKDVENRTWKTDYRGELYIHTTGDERTSILSEQFFPDNFFDNYREFENDTNKDLPEYENFKKVIKINDDTRAFYNKDDFFYKKGYIIGKVNLIDVRKDSKSKWAFKGDYHWVLENPVLFDRKDWIQTKGSLKIFEYTS